MAWPKWARYCFDNFLMSFSFSNPKMGVQIAKSLCLCAILCVCKKRDSLCILNDLFAGLHSYEATALIQSSSVTLTNDIYSWLTWILYWIWPAQLGQPSRPSLFWSSSEGIGTQKWRAWDGDLWHSSSSGF